jgi:glycosyltransferase involved in cell wall biosynthesis
MVTVHDLFHLFPFEQRVVLTDGDNAMGESVVKVGEHRPGRVRRRDLSKLKRGLSRADLLVCDSVFTREVCRREFPDVEAVTVPLGLDCEAYVPSGVGQKNPTFTMLFIGSSDSRKRLDFVFNLLQTTEEGIRQRSTLHVVGDQSQSAHALAKDIDMEVIVHPRLDDEALMRLRQEADVLLFPSAAEGYGYPPIESMAAGCPVLCSDLPAHNELMPEGACLPAGDFRAWRDALSGHFQAWDTSTAKVADEGLMGHAQKFSAEVFVQNMTVAYNALR